MRRLPPTPEPPRPILEPGYPSDLARMGLDIMVFGHYTTPDHSRSHSGATFWHPEIIAGSQPAGNGIDLIVWRKQGDPHNNYAFDGYVVQCGPFSYSSSPTCRTLAEALAWLRKTRERS